jgi:hypothetical protein
VERADKAALESGVKEAINNFVVACKDTKIWEKLGLVNIMAGARSLTGAITTLKGPVSTLVNTNFTLSDYSRKDGFTGNGTDKYFTTNTYWWNAEPLDDYHIAANAPYVDQTSTPVQPLWGEGGTTYDQLSTFRASSRSTTNYTVTSVAVSGETIRIFRTSSVQSKHTMNFVSSGKAVPVLTYENLVTTLLTDIGRALN